ncbi:MAG TPA: YcaO-like family protein, partial [Nitrososphaeraceae archaeon]
GLFAKGYGSHPDAKIAVVRALTEVSQTRAGNIHGARDDLKKIQYNESDEIYKRKWQFMPNSMTDCDESASINFFEIKSYANDDILDDIKLILHRLNQAGLSKAVVIELTNPAISIPVVRVIVPGLETFEVAKLFMANKSLVGDRAIRHFRKIHHGFIA